MASSLSAERKAILITMMLRPVLQGGMGTASEEAAIKELQTAETEVCDSLFQTGRSPDQVDAELVDLLVCKKIYVCCGRFNDVDFPWANALKDLASSDDFADTKSGSYWAQYVKTKELIEERKARAAEAVDAIVKMWPGKAYPVRKVEESPAVTPPAATPSPAAQDVAARKVKAEAVSPMVAVNMRDLPEVKAKLERLLAAGPVLTPRRPSPTRKFQRELRPVTWQPPVFNRKRAAQTPPPPPRSPSPRPLSWDDFRRRIEAKDAKEREKRARKE
ncbi:hypothetical protein QBC34DRAFT_456974 [Podospora aff. communis PSN243]|uniref:Uncharacterized protein n=1 Tax=Podospora aff. communis PSN243 TaxID=3040156 RepID=A0AAV9GUR9_9PEZI|nr:hypothetical protein QBC34DRAFT_456974 [Podospora aff. communis PSN243]